MPTYNSSWAETTTSWWLRPSQGYTTFNTGFYFDQDMLSSIASSPISPEEELPRMSDEEFDAALKDLLYGAC